MGANERRNLYYANDDNYDPTIVFDVNEYLISNWPELTAKARRAVWTISQDDDYIDFTEIEKQVNEAVYEYAETDPQCELKSEGDVPADAEYVIDLRDYFETSWPDLTEDQLDRIIDSVFDAELDLDPIYDQLDDLVYDAAEQDDTIVIPEEDDEDGDDIDAEDSETVSDSSDAEPTA